MIDHPHLRGTIAMVDPDFVHVRWDGESRTDPAWPAMVPTASVAREKR
jgi:hypothetical protein